MSEGRPWYREPETFIAVAALIVSLSAVVVGIYEASLQRAHDRAEVWPRLEISTWTSDSLVHVDLSNTGLGPGLVRSIEVDVDRRPRRSWSDVVTTLFGRPISLRSTSTVSDHAIRPGDRTIMVELNTHELPPHAFDIVGRVTIRVCYTSVFDQAWMVTGTPGKKDEWVAVNQCPVQRDSTDL